ncbi:MAG: glycosyltransferase family 2 protein, partial [Pseudomonadota bacterium]
AYPALLTRAAPSDPRAPSSPLSTPVSIVIPNRDSPALIARCLHGVFEMTQAAALDVIVVDNGSEDAETLAVYRRYEERPDFRVLFDPAPFNFSAMVNAGVAAAKFERLLLLNNDIEVVEPHWLSEMNAVLDADHAEIVGGKLLFPDRTIQHAGVIVGHGGVAGHDFKGAPEDADDPLGRMRLPHSRSAVTAAAMLTRKTVWSALSGFDERAFPVAFNDVDFCLRARERGYGVAMAPAAVLIHHEGQSRRRGLSISRFIRHKRERATLRARHGTVGMIDPFENPWRDHEALIPEWRAPKGPLRLRY